MEDLPLQSAILRSSVRTLDNRIRSIKFDGTTTEVANEAVHANTFTWTINYRPLSLEEKNLVLPFLLTHGHSKYFSFTPQCTGPLVTYTVRLSPDTLAISRRASLYNITFTLLQETYL